MAASKKDPLTLEDPSKDEDWDQYRYVQITSLVNEVGQAVRKYNKQLTAAVFPKPSLAKMICRQDWANWNLDAVMPMICHNFCNKEDSCIEEVVREDVKELPLDVGLYAGVFLSELSPDELVEALHYAHKGGQGCCLFYRTYAWLGPLEEMERCPEKL